MCRLMSKCHIVGNHMSGLILSHCRYWLYPVIFLIIKVYGFILFVFNHLSFFGSLRSHCYVM